jgi:small subunit ribosomal protein S17
MKTLLGKVISTKMAKTAVVVVESWYSHPRYKKKIRKTKKYKAHNEMGAKEGEMVELVEVRPISKEKRWKIVKILEGRG